MEEREEVRRAYYLEKKSQRRIASELQMARKTVRKAIAEAGPVAYTGGAPRPAPRLGAFKAHIDELLAESEWLPRKAHILEFSGAESYRFRTRLQRETWQTQTSALACAAAQASAAQD